MLEREKGKRWEGGTVLYYIILYLLSYIHLSNICIAKTFSNCVPGDTGYQFSSVRYYILNYCQQYISRYDSSHLEEVIQNELKITLRMIALFEYSSQ